jgi:hypothetical protein
MGNYRHGLLLQAHRLAVTRVICRPSPRREASSHGSGPRHAGRAHTARSGAGTGIRVTRPNIPPASVLERWQARATERRRAVFRYRTCRGGPARIGRYAARASRVLGADPCEVRKDWCPEAGRKPSGHTRSPPAPSARSGRGATTSAEYRTCASHCPDKTGITLKPGVRYRRLDGATERRRARFGTRHARQVAGGAVVIGEERASQVER